MGRSWSHAARLEARLRACRWEFEPEVWRVRVDDSYDRVRHTMAARHLVMSPAEYLLWCAAYVFRHHRALAPVRAEMRKWDKEERARIKAGRATIPPPKVTK